MVFIQHSLIFLLTSFFSFWIHSRILYYSISLVFSNHDSSLIFPCLSWPWNFWKGLDSYFVKCLLIWICLTLFHDWIKHEHFQQVYHKWSCAILNASVRKYTMSVSNDMLVIWTLLTWLRWCLPGFWKYVSFPKHSPGIN